MQLGYEFQRGEGGILGQRLALILGLRKLSPFREAPTTSSWRNQPRTASSFDRLRWGMSLLLRLQDDIQRLEWQLAVFLFTAAYLADEDPPEEPASARDDGR